MAFRSAYRFFHAGAATSIFLRVLILTGQRDDRVDAPARRIACDGKAGHGEA
jgi:hypothetical protein